MQLLLRKISTDSSGVQEYVDSEIEREEILLGSSPRCDIQLLDSGIAAVHARLRKQDGKIQLKAEKGRTFLRNGETCKEALLKEGDEIRIGSQTFSRTSAVPGFDLSLEWHYVEMPGHLLSNAYRTSLSELSFSPRRFSWILALATVLLLGLAPLAEYLWTGEEETVHGARPLSSLWISGPLLPAHQVVLGNDCGACHRSAFVQVRDEACQQCHSDVNNHLAATHPGLDELGEFADFDQFACQNCHKEHNEPQNIVSGSDKLCRTCHENMNPAIEGFSPHDHPEFALNLLQPEVRQLNGTLRVDWQRQKIAREDQPKESNHLKYPHDLHLDVEAVRHPLRDDALQCADCHTLSSDREHFEAISMEQHCADCHDLSFDERNPQKQLPHGSPQAVFDALEAHFVKLAFSEQRSSGFERRRLPGRQRDDENCDKDYDCARGQALREADRQFSQRGCITCHQVDQLPGAEGVERWQVLPVRLNPDWYRDARFDHQSHLTQSDETGDELCLSCHEAGTSTTSADILMPSLQQCTNCHGDKSVGGRVAVNCVACHGYHRSDGAPMSRVNLKLTGAAGELMEGVANGEF